MIKQFILLSTRSTRRVDHNCGKALQPSAFCTNFGYDSYCKPRYLVVCGRNPEGRSSL